MANEKMTNRQGYTAVIGGKITPEVIAWAQGELAKLDAKNAKRKAAEGEIKAENKPIADAILSKLSATPILSAELAKALELTTQKVNGVAGEMVKLGMISKTKVKVKNKGEQTAYYLNHTAEVAEEVAEEVEGE